MRLHSGRSSQVGHHPKVDVRGLLTISPTWVEAVGPLERVDHYTSGDFLCYFIESSAKDPIDPEAGAAVLGGPSVQVIHNQYGPVRPVDEQQTPWPRQGRCAKSRRE